MVHPNNPVAVLDVLRRKLQQSQSQQQQPGVVAANNNRNNLCIPVDDRGDVSDSSNSAPMSALPSSANLIGQDKRGGRKKRPSLPLPRQLSHLPEPATAKQVAKSVLLGLARVPALLGLLYFFICSLDFLSTAFRLIAGKTAGNVFQSSELLGNPIVGLMIGVLFTVLVQSSSTCTSVIVSMVSSGILDVRTSIPMVMGANIGTSLTSTLVSLTQLGDKEQFERAFAGATVHDCFNWLTVFILLPLEVGTGYLYNLTLWITDHMSTAAAASSTSNAAVASGAGINVLGAMTKPFTNVVVRIDKKVLECWGLGKCQEERLLKVWCNKSREALDEDPAGTRCNFLFNTDSLSDTTIGIILLVISLTMLSICLILIVKLLHSLLQGAVADLIKKTLNADIPYVPWLTGYIAILAGAVLTFIVQSSSVFTSTLTPLVGVGLISVERVYPLTLGSNLGTTTTALLASLAADGAEQFRNSVRVALCHLFFNLSGILLWYPVPFLRWPLRLCKLLGRTTAKYRWFALLYLASMFFLLPALILVLSLAGSVVFFTALIPSLLVLFISLIVNLLQEKCPKVLPLVLKSWDFLPLWMHSLDPLDRAFAKLSAYCCCCCSKYVVIATEEEELEAKAERQPEERLDSVVVMS